MSAPFHFELVSPENFVFSGDVREVIVPGSEGQFTVLAGHAPLIATLKPGIVHIHGDGIARDYFIRRGFAEVTPAGLAILAEHAQAVEEIDTTTFDGIINDLREDMADARDDQTRSKAEEKLGQILDLKEALAQKAA
jgi:F-type H+-transporting ATPase subunit epsilon